jgi:plastocyanin
MVLAAVLFGTVACAPAAGEPAPTRHTVEMRGFAFHPASLTLAPGDTVVWVNRDVVPHTATGPGDSWDSGSIGAGASWSRVFTEADTTAYLCDFHPTMTGRLIVR